MSQRKTRALFVGAVCLAGVALQNGCGGKGDASPPGDAQSEKTPARPDPSAKSPAPKTVAAKTQSAKSTQGQSQAGQPERPKPGTPPWYVQQILVLRFAKYPETDDVKKLQQLRRERNLKIVKLAEECISKTHDDPKAEAVFNAAVHQLLESRVELALQGREKDILALYDLAEVLFKRDRKSKAAADAAYKVAVFANTNAVRYPDPKAGWLTEFVRRARLFATDFPREKARAVRLLDVAGRSCELHGRTEDAVACYEQILKQFKTLPQAKRAAAVLRRLNLPGKPLELAGPTIDGGFLNVKDYRGRIVLVAFWASDSQRCRETLPILRSLSERYKRRGFEIIGVNLDKEEPVVDAYLEKARLSFPQIFYPDRNKRRWDNLIARYYAVRELPTLWLVDHNGVVVDTHVETTGLESRLQRMLRVRTASKQP